jgi:hypothetical protein
MKSTAPLNQTLPDNAAMPAQQGKKRQASETEIDRAVDIVRKKLANSAYAAEKRYGVPRVTISHRLKGMLRKCRVGDTHCSIDRDCSTFSVIYFRMARWLSAAL